MDSRLLVILILMILVIFLWMADRWKWKRKYEHCQVKQREILARKEQLDFLTEEMKQQLIQAREQISEKQNIIDEMLEQKKEKNQIFWDDQKKAVTSFETIHLYIQLVKEQCGTNAAGKHCDRILQECENYLDSFAESAGDYGDNITEK